MIIWDCQPGEWQPVLSRQLSGIYDLDLTGPRPTSAAASKWRAACTWVTRIVPSALFDLWYASMSLRGKSQITSLHGHSHMLLSCQSSDEMVPHHVDGPMPSSAYCSQLGADLHLSGTAFIHRQQQDGQGCYLPLDSMLAPCAGRVLVLGHTNHARPSIRRVLVRCLVQPKTGS